MLPGTTPIHANTPKGIYHPLSTSSLSVSLFRRRHNPLCFPLSLSSPVDDIRELFREVRGYRRRIDEVHGLVHSCRQQSPRAIPQVVGGVQLKLVLQVPVPKIAQPKKQKTTIGIDMHTSHPGRGVHTQKETCVFSFFLSPKETCVFL